MGLRFTSTEDVVALYDSVSDWAFGPIFYTEEAAEAFLKFAGDEGVPGNGDVRALDTAALVALWDKYCEQNEHARGH